MLIDISDLLDKYEIKYCLMFGTLLGAVRNDEFIETYDLDLGLFEQFWKNDDIWYKFNVDLYKSGYRVFCQETLRVFPKLVGVADSPPILEPPDPAVDIATTANVCGIKDTKRLVKLSRWSTVTDM
jgi:hypothetical protein